MTRKIFRLQLLLGFLAIILVLCVLIFLIGNYSIDKLPITKAKNQLRIVSMNVSAGNILPNLLQDNLIQTQPDIIILIEWTGNNLDLKKFNNIGYKTVLNHPRKKVHGLCILSKFDGHSTIIEAPIKTPCTLPLGQFRFKWEDNNITLFAVHAPPPVPSCKSTTFDYLEAVANWIENGELLSDLGIGKQGDNLILAGDFNSLPFSNGIKKLKNKHLQDTYSPYNFISPTWKPFRLSPYMVKIDYIFFSNKFKSGTTYRFRIDKSDHLGLVTDLTLY